MTARPVRERTPGPRRARPSMSSSVRQVPPRLVGNISSGSHSSPNRQVPPCRLTTAVRMVTLSPEREKPREGW